jgi:hypothetical protein
MVRISITPAAFEAIDATLPLGFELEVSTRRASARFGSKRHRG